MVGTPGKLNLFALFVSGLFAHPLSLNHRNIPDLWGANWYQNAQDNDDPNRNTSFVVGAGPFNTSSEAVVSSTSSALPSSTSASTAASSTASSTGTNRSASAVVSAASQEETNKSKTTKTSFAVRLSTRDTALTGFAFSLAALVALA